MSKRSPDDFDISHQAVSKKPSTMENAHTANEGCLQMPHSYSHIVIGAGAIGSAVAYWLTQRGAESVLVLEQHPLGHALGSSGDHSRMIRHSYHSTAYTALTRDMYSCWDRIEEESGLQVLYRVGGLDMAPRSNVGFADIVNYRQAMTAQNLPYENLTADQIMQLWPQWRIEDDVEGIYQPEGGFVDIRKTVSAHLALALAHGVDVRANTSVTGVTIHADSVTVTTADETFTGGHLMLATGSWLGDFMADIGLSFALTLTQEQVGYFASKHLADYSMEKMGVWSYHGDGVYYGFPVYGEAGVKLAQDMRSRFIRSEDRSPEPIASETRHLQTFLSQYLPSALGPQLVGKGCVYDMPADRDFVLDTLPGHPHVATFNGAGHGGKFASLVGKIVAELLTSGSTDHPIDAFSLTRPAIVDPDFIPAFRLV
ncbi:N-methyl-L-tryptophan oxidase [Microbacterium sp. cx-59]|uniref:N-methyl-L-tryptophan oxidase n=1 Tax=Microbacterium sp. cx-59 TaxID=2891207 RepID=UPI001E6044A3|nr:N-methyl-L-tryptophan oxidase [Microbacterium sp. cx-59]MCC4908891.1 N-methyl-L-tryptophan oxidase [Microbacterium sp. cx-59]